MSQTSCSFIDAFSSSVCFEQWLYRYQSLLVGLIAVYVAIAQLFIARSQTRIARELAAITKASKERDRIAASITIDEMLLNLRQVLNDVLSGPYLSHVAQEMDSNTGFMRFSFEPVTLKAAAGLPAAINVDHLSALALEAFPKSALDLSNLFRAARDLKEFADEYEKKPWSREDRDAVLKILKMEGAFNRFFVFSNKTSSVRMC